MADHMAYMEGGIVGISLDYQTVTLGWTSLDYAWMVTVTLS